MADTSTIDADALLADLTALPPARGSKTCFAGAALAGLPDDLRTVVELTLDSGAGTTTGLCKVLSKHGMAVSAGNLRRHKKRGEPNGCSCPRTSGVTA